ncbi:MAG: helix-turn-helix domain-containing protein [Myxococcota bacterium]
MTEQPPSGTSLYSNRADFGAFLRSARERAGLSIEELARRTCISLAVLRRIEGSDVERLPANVFVRGFLRSMARELAADGDAAIARYEDAMEALRVERTPAPLPIGDRASAPLDGRRRFAVALFVLILIVIATITVSLLLQNGPPAGGGLA